MKSWVLAIAGVVLAYAPAAVAQRADRNVDPPIIRSFNWFSYVAADDIREACRAGGRDRIRLIYNALWREQVRTYEIFLQPDGFAGLSMGALSNRIAAAEIVINGPRDTLAPWSMMRGERILNVDETREIVGLLEASAAFGPPPDGLRLPNNDFWWTVASCRAGVWGFQAYHYPTDGFARVRFAEKLFEWDNVPLAINRPRKLEPSEFRHGNYDRWILMVGTDGLRPR
ncbi:MAG: hypothetical protein K2Y40_16445 [Reyranella sp.]|nr:hypothetical protein [Reyranella sp.]